MKFKKKPVVIDAVRLEDHYSGVISALAFMYNMQIDNPIIDSDETYNEVINNGGIIITTLEGDMKAEFGDWIIRGVEGELYPCKNSVFEKTYERADTHMLNYDWGDTRLTQEVRADQTHTHTINVPTDREINEIINRLERDRGRVDENNGE